MPALPRAQTIGPLDLDDQQYASGRGPCLEAALTRTPVRAVMSEEEDRWPEFVTAAKRNGIAASQAITKAPNLRTATSRCANWPRIFSCN
jgi:hypothetical protein